MDSKKIDKMERNRKREREKQQPKDATRKTVWKDTPEMMERLKK